MAIEDTIRLVEVRGGTPGIAWDTQNVNDYLELGWRLLTVYVEDRGEPGAPNGRPCYVLGWLDASRDPVYPKSHIEREQRLNEIRQLMTRRAQE